MSSSMADASAVNRSRNTALGTAIPRPVNASVHSPSSRLRLKISENMILLVMPVIQASISALYRSSSVPIGNAINWTITANSPNATAAGKFMNAPPLP